MNKEATPKVVVSTSVPVWVESVYREEADRRKRAIAYVLREELEKSAKRRIRAAKRMVARESGGDSSN